MVVSVRANFTALLLFSSCLSAQGSLLEQPQMSWTFQIPGSGTLGGRSFRKGNSVSIHDETSTVFATSDDGSLHIIGLEISFLFEAPQVFSTFTECRSGVAFHPDGFAVYAVIDTPLGTSFIQADGSTDTAGETAR